VVTSQCAGCPQTHPNAMDEEVGGGLRKGKVLSLGTCSSCRCLSFSESQHTRPMTGLDPMRAAGWQCEAVGVAMGPHRAPGSEELQLQPGALVWCLHQSPEYQTHLLNRNLSSSRARCLAPRGRDMELGRPDNSPDAEGAKGRAQLRERRWVESNIPVNMSWKRRRLPMHELLTETTEASPVEILLKK